jgi:hypothetical protein
MSVTKIVSANPYQPANIVTVNIPRAPVTAEINDGPENVLKTPRVLDDKWPAASGTLVY